MRYKKHAYNKRAIDDSSISNVQEQYTKCSSVVWNKQLSYRVLSKIIGPRVNSCGTFLIVCRNDDFKMRVQDKSCQLLFDSDQRMSNSSKYSIIC